jgi:hypothetical protein
VLSAALPTLTPYVLCLMHERLPSLQLCSLACHLGCKPYVTRTIDRQG